MLGHKLLALKITMAFQGLMNSKPSGVSMVKEPLWLTEPGAFSSTVRDVSLKSSSPVRLGLAAMITPLPA